MKTISMKSNSWYYIIVLIMYLLIHSSAYGTIVKETYPMKLLFQELIFNIPQDKYFVIAFNPESGKSQLIESLNYEKAIILYGQNIDSSKAFVLATSENGRHRVTYMRLKDGSYVYALLSTGDNKRVEYNVPFLVADSRGFDYKNSKFELMECIYGNENQKILAREVDSFMKFPSNSTNFYIFRNGNLINQKESDKYTKGILHRKYLVTESGLITSDWGWFCERNNEKSKASLRFINLSNYKVYNGPNEVSQSKLILILLK